MSQHPIPNCCKHDNVQSHSVQRLFSPTKFAVLSLLVLFLLLLVYVCITIFFPKKGVDNPVQVNADVAPKKDSSKGVNAPVQVSADVAPKKSLYVALDISSEKTESVTSKSKLGALVSVGKFDDENYLLTNYASVVLFNKKTCQIKL